MTIDITSLVVGLLVGTLVTLSVAFPRVGRIVARTLATLLSAAGVGLLVWTIFALSTGESLRPIGWDRVNISEPSEAFGWAGGLLAAGLLALVCSFIRASDRRT